MKKDIVTAVVAAIAGALIAYFVTGLFYPEPESFTYGTIDSELEYDLAEPNPEIFNFRAINPTVEVYVGECTEYDENGKCIVTTIENEDENETEDENTDELDEDTTDETLPEEDSDNGSSD